MQAGAHCSRNRKYSRLFKAIAGSMHLTDRPRNLSILETPQALARAAKASLTLFLSDRTFLPVMGCTPRGKLENEFNQIPLYTSPGKGRASGPAAHGLCVSAYRRGGKAFTDHCCYCVSLAPSFIRLFSLFANGSQTPMLGWQLGLLEQTVFWVFAWALLL